MEADVVIIGGGMAGTIAALRAAALGADVLLIRKGHGSSAMSSGTIDVAGSDEFLPLDTWDSLPTIVQRLEHILRTNPLHPYSIIAGGRDGLAQLRTCLREAFEFALERVPSLGVGDSQGCNMVLPSVFGTVKFAAYAPGTIAAGNLLEMRDAHLLLVGITGLALFRTQICKQALHRFSSLHQPSAIARIDVVETDIPGSAEMLVSAPFEIAARFDDPHVAEEFAGGLSGQVPAGVTHIGFPPVLGLNNHAEAYEILSRELEPKIFELISPNFSVPGYRLQLSLGRALRENKVRVVAADVAAAEIDGHMVRNVVLGKVKSERTATGKTYVVATGKFSAGGLKAGDFPKESLFGLPVFCRGEQVDGTFVRDLLNEDVDGDQHLLSTGLHIDNSLRPLDAFGEPAYDNLFAAGSLIGEYDYIADKCGLGVAALTGYLAGQKAAAGTN